MYVSMHGLVIQPWTRSKGHKLIQFMEATVFILMERKIQLPQGNSIPRIITTEATAVIIFYRISNNPHRLE